MMNIADDKDRKRKQRKTIFATIVGGVLGFVFALGFLKLIDTGMLGSLGRSEEIAALIGLIYLLTGFVVAVGLVDPRFGARFLNAEDAEELREQRALLTYSVIGILAMGAALIVAALAAPTGLVPRPFVLAIFVGLIGLAWFTGARQRHYADELSKSLSRETASIAFYLMFFVGGGWALLAHTGYFPAPKPLDWLTMFAGLLLVATSVAAGKRGMLAMR